MYSPQWLSSIQIVHLCKILKQITLSRDSASIVCKSPTMSIVKELPNDYSWST
ncbi:hypothetical protein Fmac_006061 [Flemingia macrophylla]|uniref:Uncharacterized protein n=1 Tax=Flemingia macrophylla TaxID=520843 RepID=A0ABD1NA19_9FABA